MLDSNLIDNYFSKTINRPNYNSEDVRPVSFASDNTDETDKLAFLDMYSNMKEIGEDTESGAYLEEGQINGQNALLKIATSYDKNGEKFKLYQEGKIGDKNLNLEMTSKTGKRSKRYYFTGEYNNKQFDLHISYPLEKNKVSTFWNETIRNRMLIPEEVTISGTIDGKPYKLHLPNASVPKDKDQKDLTTVMLRLSGFDPAVINGKIVSLKAGIRRINSHEHRSESRKKLYHDPTVSMIIGMTLTPIVAGLTGLFKAGVINGSKSLFNLFKKIKP